MTTAWEYGAFWQKAKLYAERAMKEDREGPLFPFWATLALELLGRATLAKVHPVLLADPQQGENIMYAFGYGAPAAPKSIQATTIFSRCKVIVPNFTEIDFKTCMRLIGLRNEELHTGLPAFDGLKTQFWLAEYFRICRLLLESQKRSLADFVGADEGVAAEKMVEAAERKLIGEVKKAIANALKAFETLSPAEQAARRAPELMNAVTVGSPLDKLAECPACKAEGLLHGEKVSASSLSYDDESGDFTQDIAMLPVEFQCHSCGLHLKGYAALHVAELGGHYSVRKTYDVAEVFGFGDDDAYGND